MTSHSLSRFPAVTGAVALRQTAYVVGGAGFVGLLSQVLIPLPFTPVPISLGTLGVLLVGGVLGPLRGVLSLLVYLGAGIVGVPWFASWESGLNVPSLGYVLGYVLAAYIIGATMRHRSPTPSRILTGTLVASASVYLFGLPWLMLATGIDVRTALLLGVVPFLVGDALKIVAATVGLAGMKQLHRR